MHQKPLHVTCRLLALFRPFRTGEFMSAAALKVEVISEKSEISFSMSVIRGLSGSVFRPVKTTVHDPLRTSEFLIQRLANSDSQLRDGVRFFQLCLSQLDKEGVIIFNFAQIFIITTGQQYL